MPPTGEKKTELVSVPEASMTDLVRRPPRNESFILNCPLNVGALICTVGISCAKRRSSQHHQRCSDESTSRRKTPPHAVRCNTSPTSRRKDQHRRNEKRWNSIDHKDRCCNSRRWQDLPSREPPSNDHNHNLPQLPPSTPPLLSRRPKYRILRQKALPLDPQSRHPRQSLS